MAASVVAGYAASEPGKALSPITYTLPALGDYEVQIAITHCGVCYTDIQGIDDHYGISTYPFVPGHEIVGTVEAIGPKVRGLRRGERVGVGWQGRSCLECEWCLQGEEHLCRDIENCATWKPYGGFSSSVVVDGRFAYPLPEGMPAEHAAVLMCAGVSVYAPLTRYVPEGGQKVGVIGVGGLGHLAIQFAHALGCQVTAMSSSPGKREEALAFGADDFIDIRDAGRLREAALTFDLLLYTSHGRADWTSLLNCLATKGRLVVVGFSDEPVTFEPLELVVHQMSISGSLIGSRATMRDMLSFAHSHSIAPEVQVLPMNQVNEAIRRLKANEVRYRIVLVRDTDPA